MKVLSVNAGSSSLKFQMYEMPEEKELIYGYFERIGLENSFYQLKINGKKSKKEADLKNHSDAVKFLIEELFENNIVKDLEEIKGIGHRVVHGGDKYSTPTIINEEVIKTIEELSDLAPLHNPANLVGIKSFMEYVPNAVQVAVFDTAFHQTIKPEKYLYAVPKEWYTEYGVRKYGFHGMSHNYIYDRILEITKKETMNIIVCHLGSGASLSAIKDGKSVDTTMGFTPNAGLIMGTRSGDIDYTMIPFVMRKTGKTVEEIDDILNKQSGMQALTTVGSDFRDIEEKVMENDEVNVRAYNMYLDRVVSYIARYYFELEKVDAICLTAGVGENSPYTRENLIKRLSVLGIKLNEEVNNEIMFGKEGMISTEDSKIPCYVIPTDEEVMMARGTYSFL
jgi:acetate kinase